MNRSIQLKQTTSVFLVLFGLACFELCPAVRAVSPAPDGGYANGNTAEGTDALFSLTAGANNTALGFDALYHNTTGHYNTASGYQALFSNTTGFKNTADGFRALYLNTTGHENTAEGLQALYNNTSGFDNTAVGLDALFDNTTGNNSTANGFQALFSNTTGNNNTANGSVALYNNTTGFQNTAEGLAALYLNTTGYENIALGDFAGHDLTTGQFNIDIGNVGVAGESRTIRIGDSNQTRTFIAGIYGVNEGGTPSTVYINSNGQLGTMSSSRRFKKEIKPMDKASETILALKPVTFHYKSDNTNSAQFGLIAEEVAEVNPDLVVRDGNGEIYTVRYDAVNAMLLNEFLKEHRKVEEQQATIGRLETTAAKQVATITELKSTVAQQQKGLQTVTAQLEQQAAQIQKVSAQLEASKPAPQVVNNR